MAVGKIMNSRSELRIAQACPDVNMMSSYMRYSMARPRGPDAKSLTHGRPGLMKSIWKAWYGFSQEARHICPA